MPRIDPETVQRILDAADIVDVVSDFVKLRRSGANYKGLCPFHNERTPSFSVNKARNFCKCFSCGKGGSPVGFIMELEQMTYQEALRYLAKKYNIEIVEKDLTDAERQAASKREALMALNAFALDHFKSNLAETVEGQSTAMAYFRHRGINDAMIARFHLGYAIDRPTELLDAARKAGFNVDYMVETGLEVQTDRDGRKGYYDRYRGRVIFPIHSLSGRVVGFGARTMRSDKNIAKYVNSPESTIYHKKNELYGLYQARQAISKADKCIMVEGYLDVISMHQSGMENVVASSGTSLTEEQIRLIRRFTPNVTLVYDADAAGIKASLRGINLLLAEKMDVKVLSLPPGDDPDSFAQGHSSTEVAEYFATHEVDIIAFMTDKLMSAVDPRDPTAKAKVVNEVLRSVAYVDEPVKRQEYIAQCSRMLNVPEEVLIGQLNIFIAQRYEDAERQAARDAARRSVEHPESPVEVPPSSPGGETRQPEESAKETTTVADAPLLDLDRNPLKPYERELVRYIVRYGLLGIADTQASDGSMTSATVYDVIISEMGFDNTQFTHPPFAALVSAFGDIRTNIWPAERQKRIEAIDAEAAGRLEAQRAEIAASGGTFDQISKAERAAQAEVGVWRAQAIDEFDISFGQTRLVNSPDAEVRTLASELLVERYTLSRIYSRGAPVPTEQEQLAVLVPRAIDELRSAIIAAMISDLARELASLTPEADPDGSKASEILVNMARCKAYQHTLGKALGDRIIMPAIR